LDVYNIYIILCVHVYIYILFFIMRTVLFLTSGFLNFFRKVRFSFSLLFLSLFLLSVLFSVFQMDDG